MLPRQLRRTTFYIVNMQDHDEGNGTHWVVFYYNNPLTSIYFDSFGFVAPLQVENRINPYIFNDADVQDYNSSACGYFCIAFIKFLHNKQDKQEAFKGFLKLFKNEQWKMTKYCKDCYINYYNLKKIIIIVDFSNPESPKSYV